MAANSSRPNLKRPFQEDDGLEALNKPPAEKKIRFPKGKKARTGDEKASVASAPAETIAELEARRAAKERAKRRAELTSAQFNDDGKGLVDDISVAEATYEDYETFVEDGVPIEPFSLNKEREEGYFDADMNYVEYVKEKEIKDAWLDSIEADPKYAGKAADISMDGDDEVEELTSRDIGAIKRRIADVLEPGETILKALRRLKGNTNNRKDKMSPETKSRFDQLTEDAMKLMDNGEYDVYHEKQGLFQREADLYENLARLKEEGPFSSNGNKTSDSGKNISSGITDVGSSGSVNPSSDALDMFADDDDDDDDDEHVTAKSTVPETSVGVDSTNTHLSNSEGGDIQSDYVLDESSGYYYSSSLGYYYDPSTKLYCSAASGQWYSYSEETGTYDEVQAATENGE